MLIETKYKWEDLNDSKRDIVDAMLISTGLMECGGDYLINARNIFATAYVDYRMASRISRGFSQDEALNRILFRDYVGFEDY